MVFCKCYPKCVVIIDCFKIFINHPTNLLAQAQTFSSYKHQHTVKYLIGVTSQGTVSFISDGWGGRTSDKYVTEIHNVAHSLVTWFQMTQFLLTVGLTFVTRLVSTVHNLPFLLHKKEKSAGKNCF